MIFLCLRNLLPFVPPSTFPFTLTFTCVGPVKSLKEQYSVTAHAPNFEFWTGCREIKRCEESKRTLNLFWRYFYCRWLEDQKMGSALMPIEGLFLLLASIQAQIIVKGIRRNETATIKTVRKKPLRH